MADLASFATDPTKESEGVWREWRGGIRVRIARMWSAAFDKVWASLLMELSEEGKGEFGEEEKSALMVKACARSILVDWALVDGLIGSDGLPRSLAPINPESDHEIAAWAKMAERAQKKHIGEDDSGDPVYVLEFMGEDGHTYRACPEDGENVYRRVIVYTPDLGEQILAMSEYRDLFKFVETLSMQSAMFRAETKKETVGN